MIRTQQQNSSRVGLQGLTRQFVPPVVVASRSQFRNTRGMPRSNWIPRTQRPINIVGAGELDLTRSDKAAIGPVLLETPGVCQSELTIALLSLRCHHRESVRVI